MTGCGVLVYGSLLHEPTLAATLSEATVADAVLVPDVPEAEFTEC
jgi:hypothetical protein